MLRQEKGITLVALVITIIILIILAAVTITSITGDHSVLSQTEIAKCMSAYTQADDQVKLSYGAIRSKIAIEAGKDSNYDARNEENAKVLVEMLKEDLKDDKSFSVATVTQDVTEDGKTVKKVTTIYVKYENKAITKGLIDEGNTTASPVEPAVPRYNAYSYAKISLSEQKATYTWDIDEGDKVDAGATAVKDIAKGEWTRWAPKAAE